MKNFFQKDYPVVFIFLAVLIFFPAWQSGYLFFLDWSVDPYLSLGDISGWDYSLGRMFYVLAAAILPFGFLQKIILFLLVCFLGIGGWKLAETLIENEKDKKSDSALWAKYFAGFLMIFNPFVYGRLADGQFGVALGAVLFILFFVIHLVRYFKNRKRKNLILAGLFSGLAVMFSPHSIFFVLAITGVFFIGNIIQTKKYWVNIWKSGAVVLIMLFLNANVVAGYLLNKDRDSRAFYNFNQDHLEAFDTADYDNTSVYFNVLSLHGYWGEREMRFISTQNYNFIWKPLFLLIFALAVFGVAMGIRKKNKNVIPLAVLAALSWILAIGIAAPLVKPISQFLYNNVPYYIGLREPQKWAGILLIAYAGLGSLGVRHFLELKEVKKYISAWGVGIIFAILIYTPTMFLGFLGQLKPADFPPDWYSMKSYLNLNTEGGILFLPWHQYMEVGFLGDKEIVNPAKAFFGDRVIQGDNMEVSTVFTQSGRPESKVIERYILSEDKINENEFISDLKEMGINYVLLLKAEDFEDYYWLDEMKLLPVVRDSENFRLYKINKTIDN